MDTTLIIINATGGNIENDWGGDVDCPEMMTDGAMLSHFGRRGFSSY